jgi:hypothetical protein
VPATRIESTSRAELAKLDEYDLRPLRALGIDGS